MSRESLDYTVAPEDRVPVARKMLYSTGAFADPLVSGTVGGHTILFYSGILGLSGALVGGILFAPRIWDAITDPWIGKLSDNCTSPMGRRRPYFFFGGLLMIIAFILLWAPPRSLPMPAGLALYLLVVSIVFYTGYTAFTIPYNAMAVEMTPDYKERTTLMSVRKMFHGGGEMLIGAMPFLATKWLPERFPDVDARMGFAMVGLGMGAAAAIMITIAFLGSRERPAAEMAGSLSFWNSVRLTWRNRVFRRLTLAVLSLVLSIFALATYGGFLFMFYLDRVDLLFWTGLYGGILGILVAPLWARIGNRIGKPGALVLAQSIIMFASILTFFCISRTHPNLAFVYYTFYACAWSGLLILLASLLADIIDMDELDTGERREGSYGGVFGFIFKLGIAGSAPIMGFGLDWARFNSDLGTAQTDSTFLRLRLLTCVGGAVFSGIALLLLWRFPLSPEQALDIRKRLEERRGKRSAAVIETGP